jgi:hypothetical protein
MGQKIILKLAIHHATAQGMKAAQKTLTGRSGLQPLRTRCFQLPAALNLKGGRNKGESGLCSVKNLKSLLIVSRWRMVAIAQILFLPIILCAV